MNIQHIVMLITLTAVFTLLTYLAVNFINPSPAISLCLLIGASIALIVDWYLIRITRPDINYMDGE